MTKLTFTHLDRLTEEELTQSMRGVSHLFMIYEDQRREAMAGVWGSLLEVLDLEWDRREVGEGPHPVAVEFGTLPRLTRDEIQMVLSATRGVRDASSEAGRMGRADLYACVVAALEEESRRRSAGWRGSPGRPAGPLVEDAASPAA